MWIGDNVFAVEGLAIRIEVRCAIWPELFPQVRCQDRQPLGAAESAVAAYALIGASLPER
jgi:hypothetical protein